jgi:shikimate dehydrogenase
MIVTGRTAVYGIIGWPISHSLSPLMQNAAFAATGIDGIYVPFPLAPEALVEGVRGLAASGVRGFNVTIPHKAAIVGVMDELAPSARLAGAVNVVCVCDGRLIGHNTDGEGLLVSLREEFSFSAAGQSVLILGGGGAARGASVALAAAGAARLHLANRSREKAEEIADACRAQFPTVDCRAWSLEDVLSSPLLSEYRLCINTTSVGMAGDAFDPRLVNSLPITGAVYDMVYAPLETPLLRQARGRGIRTANGLGMLAAQGEAAFRLWTGDDPPQGLMKRCLLEAVAGSAA